MKNLLEHDLFDQFPYLTVQSYKKACESALKKLNEHNYTTEEIMDYINGYALGVREVAVEVTCNLAKLKKELTIEFITDVTELPTQEVEQIIDEYFECFLNVKDNNS